MAFKNIICTLLPTSTLQFFKNWFLVYIIQFLELDQIWIFHSTLISIGNKVTTFRQRYSRWKCYFWILPYSSKLEDGLVTLSLKKYLVLYDILHIKRLALCVLLIAASFISGFLYRLLTYSQNLILLIKNYKVFGYISISATSLLLCLYPCTTYQNSFLIHTIDNWIIY